MDQLVGWLARANPDVVCLQETKVQDCDFPHDALGEAGYRAECFGQKTYNGVSIAVRFGLGMEAVERGLDGDDETAPKRLISAMVEGVRVINVYVPNGQAVGTEPFAYKLAWLERLGRHFTARYTRNDDVVICGDFNVAPEPIDVHDPKKWEGNVLFHPDERAALRKLLSLGLVDIFREKHPGEPHLYSWWDYRMGAFKKDRGLRIDLALVTEHLAQRCVAANIDRRPRELDRPSDHAPVVVEVS